MANHLCMMLAVLAIGLAVGTTLDSVDAGAMVRVLAILALTEVMARTWVRL